MGSYWSSDIWSDIPSQKIDIKPIERTYIQKEESLVTVVEYPVGYIDELKKKLIYNDSRSSEPPSN